MAVILQERGFGDMSKVRAECHKFKCDPKNPRCCCRRMLYNEPDFVNVNSILTSACQARGFQVLYLPKFHCELNFIEQCWGHAKRLYRLNPPSPKEDDLESNVIAALGAVPLVTMRRWAIATVSRWRQTHTSLLDMLLGLGDLWMHIWRDFQANRLHGPERSIMVTVCFLRH